MKIAMFAHNYLPHPGGLEVMVWNLARGLGQRHEVVLVTSAYGGQTGVSREDGIEVHRVPSMHFSERVDIPYPIPTGVALRRASSAAANADIVHAHGALYAHTLMARRLARRSKAPLVLTEHVGWVQYTSALVNGMQGLAWKLIGDGTLRRSAAVVTYNARVQGWLERRQKGMVHFVGNGVDLTRFRPRCADERRRIRGSLGLPERAVLALFVGRAAAKKNLDAVLASRPEGVTLVVCGAARAMDNEQTINLGFVPYERMPDLFAAADVMVHAGTGEGFPLAVQEAIASGVPVVLLWDDGYARLLPKELVAACDDLEEIRPRLTELAASAERRAALAAACRQWAEQRWTWDATVAAYDGIYRDALQQYATADLP